MNLQNWMESVSALDEGAMAEARERQAQLAKPPGSLGKSIFGVCPHMPLLCGKQIPISGSRTVLWDTVAAAIADPQLILGGRIAFLGSKSQIFYIHPVTHRFPPHMKLFCAKCFSGASVHRSP